MQVKLMDAIGSAAEQRIARLCNILATMPVMPVHRLAFIALAAEKNFIAENYGTASGLLSVSASFVYSRFVSLTPTDNERSRPLGQGASGTDAC